MVSELAVALAPVALAPVALAPVALARTLTATLTLTAALTLAHTPCDLQGARLEEHLTGTESGTGLGQG